jgi:hypothetical protein
LKSQHAENRRGIPARALLLMLRAYQTFLSPLNFSGCKFYPSCSRYAYEAVERFGARHGAWLAFRRLLRCRPFSHGGFDPVPDAAPHSHAASARVPHSQPQNDESGTHGQEFAK